MKNRKRKHEYSRRSDPVPQKNCIIERTITDINYYGSLVEPSLQRCEFCEMEFMNRYDSLKHTARHIIIPLIKQSIYVCKDCLFCFTSFKDLQNHRQNKHNAEKINDIIERVVKTQLQVKCDNLNLNINKQQPNKEFPVAKPLNKLITNLPKGITVTKLKEKTNAKSTPDKKALKGIVIQPKQKPISEISHSLNNASGSLTPALPVPVQEKAPEQVVLPILPPYSFPLSNNVANPTITNQIFQIQQMPPLPQFQPQPFLTLIPGSMFPIVSPPEKPEEEFILPDLEPSPPKPISMQQVKKEMTSNPTNLTTQRLEERSPNLIKIIKPGPAISKPQPKTLKQATLPPKQDTTTLRPTNPTNKHIISMDTLNLLDKSPLLMKQLLMKPPAMTSSFKNRIVFEEDLYQEDNIISLTGNQPRKNPPNITIQNNPVEDNTPFYKNGLNRLVIVENSRIRQELNTGANVPMLPGKNFTQHPTNGKLFNEPVGYNKLIQPGMFRCKRCPKIFPDRYDAIVHEATHLQIQAFIRGQLCRNCDYYIPWSRVLNHRQKCQGKRIENVSVCVQCSLYFGDKSRHDMIYHHIFKCTCNVVFNSKEDLIHHKEISLCTGSKVLKLCEVCEVFITKRGNVKHEVLSSLKQYGKKYKCNKCHSLVDEVTIIRILKVCSKRTYELTGDKKKVKTNEDRLKSIKKRLKNITLMGKF